MDRWVTPFAYMHAYLLANMIFSVVWGTDKLFEFCDNWLLCRCRKTAAGDWRKESEACVGVVLEIKFMREVLSRAMQ